MFAKFKSSEHKRIVGFVIASIFIVSIVICIIVYFSKSSKLPSSLETDFSCNFDIDCKRDMICINSICSAFVDSTTNAKIVTTNTKEKSMNGDSCLFEHDCEKNLICTNFLCVIPTTTTTLTTQTTTTTTTATTKNTISTTSRTTNTTKTVKIWKKSGGNFRKIFNNLRIWKSIHNNYKFLCNFEIVRLTDSYYEYYLTDHQIGYKNIVRVFTEMWVFLEPSIKYFDHVIAYIKSINGALVISSNNALYKVDHDLRILKTYEASNAEYRGSYYDEDIERIYVIRESDGDIEIFNKNLKFQASIKLNSNLKTKPYRLTGHQGKIYTNVGDTIYVIQGEKVVNFTKHNKCTNYSTSSILFDDDDYMTILCDGKFHLFYPDGKYAKTVNTKTSEKSYVDFGFDRSGRLVLVTGEQLFVYDL